MEPEKAQLDFQGWIMLSADPGSIIHFFLRLLASLESGSNICFSELITNEEKKEVKASVRWGLALLQRYGLYLNERVYIFRKDTSEGQIN